MLKVCLCESNIVSIKFVTSIFVKKKKNYENYYICRVCLDTTYFAENWKYCSKIIFKCVNSIVGPILMKICVKRGLWVPWTIHGTHWKAMSTAYFVGQEIVGLVHSARDLLTDVMERFSIKKKNADDKTQPLSKRCSKLALGVLISHISHSGKIYGH